MKLQAPTIEELLQIINERASTPNKLNRSNVYLFK